jgi:hypothetical protein
MDREAIPLFYEEKLIYLYIKKSGDFGIDEKSLSQLFSVPESFFEDIRKEERVQEEKHFSKISIERVPKNGEKNDLFIWNKKGLIRLAYILNSENSLEIIENLQEIELKDRREPFLFEIENILKERIEEIKSGKDLSKIDSFIETLSKYLKEKEAIFQRKEGGVKNFITDLFNELVQKSSQK